MTEQTPQDPAGSENEKAELPDPALIENRARASAFGTPDGFLAFGFGAGLFTRAPGTMGTLAAVPVAVLVNTLGVPQFWFVTLSFILGVWICNRVTRSLGVEDYGGIVWDEMVGFWLIAAFLPLDWAWYLLAFVFFRGFDILKPWPISALESRFDGGLGIMIDDILAAVYTILIVSFARQVITGNVVQSM